MVGNEHFSQKLTCLEKQIRRFFNEGTKVVGQSVKALEQLAMKRTCGSHLPPLDQKMSEENRGIEQANRQ